MSFMWKGTSSSLAAILICAGCLQARVTRIVVERRESPAFDGQAFGKAGPYEMLSGHFYGEIDPKDPHNSIINDIQFAPRNARGMVEYSATFALSKPIDMSKSNGVLYYSVSNRGRGAPAGSEDGRDQPAERMAGRSSPAYGRADDRGSRRAALRWLAVDRSGSGATGQHSSEYHDRGPAHDSVRRPHVSAPADARYGQGEPAAADARRARRPASVPATDWAFADCSATPFPGKPDPAKICMKDGFDPASEYVLVYTAKDPLVLGIGYAATRDLNSFLRYASDDTTDNPLGGQSAMGNQPRRFPIRQLHPQLHPSGLQSG